MTDEELKNWREVWVQEGGTALLAAVGGWVGIVRLVEGLLLARQLLRDADKWMLNNPSVTSWGQMNAVEDAERGRIRQAIAEALGPVPAAPIEPLPETPREEP